MAPSVVAAGMFHDFNEMLKLIHSSIFFRRFSRTLSQLRQLSWVTSKFADCSSYRSRIVRIGNHAAAIFQDNACCVALLGSHHKHWSSCGENRIEFARYDHALEPALDRNDMDIARHHHVRY